MKTIKLIVVALFVALAGASYAVGSAQDATHANHAPRTTCCAAHKNDAKQGTHSCNTKEGKGCCTSAAGCCAGHSQKASQPAGSAGQSAKNKLAASCCKGHKAASTKPATAKQAGSDAKSSCCGNDCCKDCQGHEVGSDTKSVAVAQKSEGESCCASCGACCRHQVASN